MPSVVMNDIVVNGSGSIVDSTVYSHVVDRYYDIHKTQPFHRLQVCEFAQLNTNVK